MSEGMKTKDVQEQAEKHPRMKADTLMELAKTHFEPDEEPLSAVERVLHHEDRIGRGEAQRYNRRYELANGLLCQEDGWIRFRDFLL